MSRPLVIIHGWSDHAGTFQALARLVADRRGDPVSIISLGQYISMNDQVTFDDLASAMDHAWDDHGLPRGPASVDAVVHSTGGLVIRHWMTRNFRPDQAPVKNLVMLAPANFGSGLAHKGRAFAGRVAKGFGNSEWRFQTGAKILKGLELASPFSWRLAMLDRLGPWAAAYAPGGILCTVLVGNRGYDGLRSLANEDGSDGTVRLSTSNLDPLGLEIDYTDPAAPVVRRTEPPERTAFGVIDGVHHGSITLADDEDLTKARRDEVLDLIVGALDVTDSGFAAWRARLDAQTDAVMDKGKNRDATQGYQNTVVRVIDHDGHPVTDYLVEFHQRDDDTSALAEFFQRDALWKVHNYGDDASYRSLYVNCTRLRRAIDKENESLLLRITAYPIIGHGAPVGFAAAPDGSTHGLEIAAGRIEDFFRPNRTALVTLTLKRHREDRVFRFHRAGT